MHELNSHIRNQFIRTTKHFYDTLACRPTCTLTTRIAHTSTCRSIHTQQHKILKPKNYCMYMSQQN